MRWRSRSPEVGGDLAHLLNLCAENLQHGYVSPGGTLAAAVGIGLVLALCTRVLWCTVRAVSSNRRERAARLTVLDLVCRTDLLSGVLVLTHATPYAFCVGGRQQRIVVTSALLENLDTAELDAVLAHERAHLRQRHHTALTISRILFDALGPLFPGFRSGMREVEFLVELSADDSARARIGAHPLRQALTTLACLRPASSTLAASAVEVEARIRRLDGQHQRLPQPMLAASSVGFGAAILLPLALATAPALAMAWEGLCLLG
ncbi:hypothetical protein GCM10027062_32000 [Nocardioides hungaricus]